MKNRVKVSFPLLDDGAVSVERMWALSVGDNQFVLDNIPYNFYGISYCDEFLACEIDGELVFSEITSRGGHSTYRIRLPEGKDHSYFLEYWEKLGKEGCTFEGSSENPGRLYAVDIPPGVSVEKVYRILENFENQDVWGFEEGHYFDGHASVN